MGGRESKGSSGERCPASRGACRQKGACPLVSTISVEELERLIKAYADWCDGSVSEVRPCPHCPCRFRHKHGYARRQVGLDLGAALPIGILRIRCPRCRKAERIWPPWLSADSTYPLPVQE